MKKTLAALGATVLGFGTATAVAAPVAADPEPLPECTDFQEQVDSIDGLGSEWFGDCIPQYGLGKAEFTIVADEDDPSVELPENFVELPAFADPDSPVSASSTLDVEAMNDYLTSFVETEEGELIYPVSPVVTADGTASSQTYVSLVVSPVASAGPVTEENTPEEIIAGCVAALPDDPLIAGWVATYDPIDTTFTQTVDGRDWTFEIAAQSAPTYFFVSEDGGACVTDGETFLTDTEVGTELFYVFVLVMPFLPEDFDWTGPVSLEGALSEFDASQFAAIGETGLFDLGTFGPLDPAPQPVLAATGADGSALLVPALIAGGIVIAGGALITITILRRRRDSQS